MLRFMWKVEQGAAHERRLIWVVLMFIVACSLLAYRAVKLHWADAEFLKQEGDKRAIRTLALPAKRGIITDRQGVPLAISTPVVSLWVEPQVLLDRPLSLPRLAQLLSMDVQALSEKLALHADKSFLYLKRHLDPEAAEHILNERFAGVHGQTEYKRFYPAGAATAHLLGFAGVDHKGQEGLELAFDDLLKGESGSYELIKDRKGKMIAHLGMTKDPEPGRDLRLSIDMRLQYFAYRALQEAVQKHDAQGGSVVALDPRTGELLAMVNQPSYNPNNRVDLQLQAVRNRAVTDVFEPGSTIKPFTILAALDSGLYDAGTLVDTAPGTLHIGTKAIRDLHDYGLLDVTGVLTKSSNVGASKIALSLPNNHMFHWFNRLGLGQSTGVGLPGEREGWLPIHTYKRQLATATLSFGYGLSVTALQLAQAYAVVANNGEKKPLSLLSQLRQSIPGEKVVDVKLARELTRMLETVTGEEGTAKRAAIPGYRVAGKTGTVHKIVKTGYAKDQYLSLFAGYVPAEQPRVVMVVVIDEPTKGHYYGGRVAAPVFARACSDMLRLMGVPTDQPRLDPPLLAMKRW